MTDDKIQLLRGNDLQPHKEINRFASLKNNNKSRENDSNGPEPSIYRCLKGRWWCVVPKPARAKTRRGRGQERRREPERSVSSYLELFALRNTGGLAFRGVAVGVLFHWSGHGGCLDGL